MLTTIALTSALVLTPAQAGNGPEITNIHATYGILGPERKDNHVLPGDVYVVRFDVDNMTVTKEGVVQYSLEMEVVDAKNKLVFKQDPQVLEWVNSLGGRSLPSFAHVVVGSDQAPGEYTMRVTVTDRGVKDKNAKNKATLERKFEVLDKGFGLVSVFMTSDSGGQVGVPPVGVPGQSLWINFAVTGFKTLTARKPGDPTADVVLEGDVQDENGKSVLERPVNIGKVRDAIKGRPMVGAHFLVALNRPGKFTIVVTGNDKAGGKTAKLSLPITVLDIYK